MTAETPSRNTPGYTAYRVTTQTKTWRKMLPGKFTGLTELVIYGHCPVCEVYWGFNYTSSAKTFPQNKDDVASISLLPDKHSKLPGSWILCKAWRWEGKLLSHPDKGCLAFQPSIQLYPPVPDTLKAPPWREQTLLVTYLRRSIYSQSSQSLFHFPTNRDSTQANQRLICSKLPFFFFFSIFLISFLGFLTRSPWAFRWKTVELWSLYLILLSSTTCCSI